MPILFLAIPAILAAYLFLQDFGAEPGLTRAEAQASFPQKVARWYKEAGSAARKHSVPAKVLLSICAQESSGERVGMHPDGVSYGLMGLTPIALDDVQDPRDRTELSAAQQFDVAAEFLALQRTRTGTLFDALKWYNSGSNGGGSYAVEVLNRAGMGDRISAGHNTTQDGGQSQPQALAPNELNTQVQPPTSAQADSTSTGGACEKYGFCGDGSAEETEAAPTVEPTPSPSLGGTEQQTTSDADTGETSTQTEPETETEPVQDIEGSVYGGTYGSFDRPMLTAV